MFYMYNYNIMGLKFTLNQNWVLSTLHIKMYACVNIILNLICQYRLKINYFVLGNLKVINVRLF